jgi:hypothetical protein
VRHSGRPSSSRQLSRGHAKGSLPIMARRVCRAQRIGRTPSHTTERGPIKCVGSFCRSVQGRIHRDPENKCALRTLETSFLGAAAPSRCGVPSSSAGLFAPRRSTICGFAADRLPLPGAALGVYASPLCLSGTGEADAPSARARPLRSGRDAAVLLRFGLARTARFAFLLRFRTSPDIPVRALDTMLLARMPGSSQCD